METARRALHDVRIVIGPSVPVGDAALSLRVACHALTLAHRGVITPHSAVRCDDHLPTLLMMSDEGLLRILMRQRLDGFSDLRPDTRRRLTETLLTWIATGASSPVIGHRLRLHPQTIRYRMQQLIGLFGGKLNDPEWRFGMQLALRADQLFAGETEAGRDRGDPGAVGNA